MTSYRSDTIHPLILLFTVIASKHKVLNILVLDTPIYPSSSGALNAFSSVFDQPFFSSSTLCPSFDIDVGLSDASHIAPSTRSIVSNYLFNIQIRWGTFILTSSPTSPPPINSKMSGADRAKTIFSDLLSENAKYAQGDSSSQATLSPASLRTDLATNGQHPVAAIIACADSRVSPEIVFNAGIGHLFVIRTAGNVAWGDATVGSLEYAVDHLDVPLVIVLGHSKCGAVGAAVASIGAAPAGESQLGRHVARLADVVRPVVDRPDVGKVSVETVVQDGVLRLKNAPGGVGKAVKEGRAVVMGAVYDIDTGLVHQV